MQIDRAQIQSLAMLAGLVAVLVLGLWLPTHSRTRRVQQQIDQMLLVNNASEVRPLGELKATIHQLQRKLDSSDRYLPETTELSSLLRDLSAHADALKVDRLHVEKLDPKKGSSYQVTPVMLSFSGSFESVFHFVREIESMRRLVRINRLDLKVDGKPMGVGRRINVRVQLDTFASNVEAKAA